MIISQKSVLYIDDWGGLTPDDCPKAVSVKNPDSFGTHVHEYFTGSAWHKASYCPMACGEGTLWVRMDHRFELDQRAVQLVTEYA